MFIFTFLWWAAGLKMSRKMGIIRSDPRKILSGRILGLIRIEEAAPQQVLPHSSSSSSGSFLWDDKFFWVCKTSHGAPQVWLKSPGILGNFLFLVLRLSGANFGVFLPAQEGWE